MENSFIYLDNNATTPLDKKVLDAMFPYFINDFGNSSSIHDFGKISNKAVESAKKNIATLINSTSQELTFTSGATESINIALKGLALHPNNTKRHIVTVKTEHKAVLDTCKYLETVGFKIDYLPVNNDGLINLKELKNRIQEDTLLVCVMWVNNETGVIQPINEISDLVHKAGSLFMTDATQAVGKIPVDVQKDGIDLMTFTGHKMYGPKGVGALYVRRKNPRVKVTAQMDGGGHERGMRSGTLNVPGIVGMGKACELCMQDMEGDTKRISKMRDKLETALMLLEEAYINGSTEHRLPHVTNISFKHVEGEGLLMGFNKNIALSSGSACTSASLEPSYVLKALGLGDDLAHSSLRFGLGRFTQEDQIDYTVKAISETVLKLREMSPLWEMYKEGIDLDSIEWAAH